MVTIGSELPPGTLIDRRYQIRCVLGRGGFGRTYLASDKRRFGEFCVLKEFVPKSQGDAVVAQKLHELFHREAQTLHQLNHPQIPKFFAVFEENDRLFIAQEYIDGKTYWKLLQERQRRGTAFSEIEVFEWLRHLLPVLDYLHRKNIVHRDISPDNIMLPRKGRRLPVLIDFGVVKQAAPHWYEVSTINPDGSIEASVSVGKLGYAPYEQIRIGQCSPRSDLYALAVTAAVMLTARPPNALIDPKSLEWKWQSLVRVHPQFARILERMMAEKPQDRYPSARLVLEDLELLSQHSGIEPSDRPRPALQSDSRQSVTQQAITQQAITQQAITPAQGDTTLFPLSQSSIERYSRLESTLLEVVHSVGGDTSRTAKARPNTDRRTSRTSVDTYRQTIRTQKQGATLTLPGSSHTIDRPLADIPATNLSILSREPAKFSIKKALLLSLLTVVPLGGIAVGVQSPYISALCRSLDNCADEQPLRLYRQVAQQADSAIALSEQAQTLADLQKARDRLSQTIPQLAALPASNPFFNAAQRQLPGYRQMLQRLDQRLEKESRSAELLQRATTEARMAEQQTRTATTLPQLTTARSQWRRALATLGAVSDSTFVADQAQARSRQYTTRLQTVEQRLVAIRPQSSPADAAIPLSAKPAVLPPPVLPAPSVAPVPPAEPAPSATVLSPAPQPSIQAAPQIIASQPQPSPEVVPSPEPSIAALPEPSLPSSSSVNASAQAQPALPAASAPNRFLSNQILTPLSPSIAEVKPGNVNLTASETLDAVSVRLNGARVSSRGTFVANLQVDNQSNRPFGFVPLFAEVRDASGQSIPARLRLSSGSEDGMVNPGEQLHGEVYLLDRYWNTSGNQNLTLVIREGTSGSRNFHLDF